jgi:hypothetical protein
MLRAARGLHVRFSQVEQLHGPEGLALQSGLHGFQLRHQVGRPLALSGESQLEHPGDALKDRRRLHEEFAHDRAFASPLQRGEPFDGSVRGRRHDDRDHGVFGWH